MLLGLHPLNRLGDEGLDQLRLCLSGQALERAGEADEFRRRLAGADAVQLAGQQALLALRREAAGRPCARE